MMKEIANRYALKSLLNSMIRDYSPCDYISLSDESLIIYLDDNKVLKFDIESISLLGGHRYTGRITIDDRQVTFDEMLPSLLSVFQNVDESFTANIINSRNNIVLILNHRKEEGIDISNYLASEQDLLLGHPFHPYPKCKQGMSNDDLYEYSPEFKASLKLFWIKCHRDYIESNIEFTEALAYMKELFKFDVVSPESDDNFLIVPMHPWQWNKLSTREDIRTLIKYGIIIPLCEGRNEWSILSSVRSLYHCNAPLLVKYSMDLKLTNSIRHLRPEESIRGQQIKAVFKNEGVAGSIEKLDILFEPFFLALRDMKGRLIVESTIQLRENFNKNFDAQNSLLLATLAEENPFIGATHLSLKIKDIAVAYAGNTLLAQKVWFEAFLKNVVGEFINLSEKHGILLGAHMQNIILKLEEGLPKGAIFRDCQGTGFTQKSLESFGAKYEFIENTKGNILDKDDVNKVYTYYLVINTVFNTIIAIANGQQETERYLLCLFRNFIHTRNDSSSFLNFLLNSEYLFQKGNFRCCISNLNENTIDNPWNIYNKIENPLIVNLRAPRKYEGELYRVELSNSRTLTLRAFDLCRDMEVFHQWHNKDYVSEFWEMNKSIDELRDYVLGLKKSPYQLPVMMDINGQAAGYFEVYWAYDDRIAPYCNASIFDRGIHILIGDERYLRTRVVSDSVFHLSKFLFEDDYRTQRIWGEPRVDNSKVLKLAELLPGWAHVGVFDFSHKTSNLLECDRERFYKEMK